MWAMKYDETRSGLKFSIKASWAPLHINEKLIAGRIMPLYRIDETTYQHIDDRGKMLLQDFFYSEHGFLCDRNDKALTPVDFLKKNHIISHAFFISFDRTIIVAGYNVFHYRCTALNPPAGIHIDYFSSAAINYPDDIRPAYLGNYSRNETFYKVRGVGRATISLACSYACELNQSRERAGIAVDLTARSDNELIQRLYIEKYGFEFYEGARGKKNEMCMNFKKARLFIKRYESGHKTLERPEGNGLTYITPSKH
jgi:hypothetical protein